MYVSSVISSEKSLMLNSYCLRKTKILVYFSDDCLCFYLFISTRGPLSAQTDSLRTLLPAILQKHRRISVKFTSLLLFCSRLLLILQISAQKLLPQNSFPKCKVCPPHYCYPRLLFKSTLFVSLAFYHLPQLACFLNYFSSYYTLQKCTAQYGSRQPQVVTEYLTCGWCKLRCAVNVLYTLDYKAWYKKKKMQTI